MKKKKKNQRRPDSSLEKSKLDFSLKSFMQVIYPFKSILSIYFLTERYEQKKERGEIKDS
jgi:hypothetical protein